MEIKNGQFDSLLHLVGLREKSKAKHPRTISAREARRRVEHVLPGLTAPKDELDDLINVRDGIIHVGYLAEANTREILTAYLRFANALYEELEIPAGQRWGSHTELVNSLISQSLTEIEHQVQRKIAAAKRFFTELMDKLPEGEHEGVAAARQANYPPALNGEEWPERINCPACNDAYATCIGVVETDYDPDVIVEDGYATVVGGGAIYTLHARRLMCGCCTLQLDSPGRAEGGGARHVIYH